MGHSTSQKTNDESFEINVGQYYKIWPTLLLIKSCDSISTNQNQMAKMT